MERFSVAIQVRDAGIRESLIGIIGSGEDFYIMPEGSPDTPDLYLMEVGDDPEQEFQAIGGYLASQAEVFLTSSHPAGAAP